MRKKYSVLALIFLLFASCDKDDGDSASGLTPPRDTISPVVEISSPEPNASFLLIDRIIVKAKVTDNRKLEAVRMYVTDPSGDRKLVYEHTGVGFSFGEYNISIPLHKDALVGSYTVLVEVTDLADNVASDSRTFTIESPAIGQSEFTRTFTLGKTMSALDWYGYQPNDRIHFNRYWFNLSFQVMINKDQEIRISEAEWKKFTADFGVQDHNWSNWDENDDGQLDDEEFEMAMNSLPFFHEWDTDKDSIIRGEEMSKGFFLRWDSNKDGMLSREEYQEKFFYYLLE